VDRHDVSAHASALERRLLWRCRRGTKELDVLLERYALAAFPGAGAEERAAFARLLELPDPLLVDYLLNGMEPDDPPLAHLVRRIRATSALWQSGRSSGMILDASGSPVPR
jgi:antitoxin CptB